MTAQRPRRSATWFVACGLVLRIASVAAAADAVEAEPLLRLDTGGPASFVTALTFEPGSRTLYAGGFDKLVRAWSLAGDRFELDQQQTIRVPVGPGLDGAVNAVAVSADGQYVAVAGRGVVKGAAGFRQAGRILPSAGSMTAEMQRDEGTIYLIERSSQAVQVLRGHRGPVLAVAFSQDPDGHPVLASAAREAVAQSSDRKATVRLWDVRERKQLRSTYVDLSVSDGPAAENTVPQLVVRRIGAAPLDVQVAIAWSDGRFRVWDPRTEPVGKLQPPRGAAANDGRLNGTVTLLPGDPATGPWLTGSLQGWDGQLRFWQVDGNGVPRGAGRPITLPPHDARHLVPRAIAAVPSDKGPLIAVASLALTTGPGGGNALQPVALELQLIETSPARQVFSRQLWPIRGALGVPQPRLAASRDGQWLAVSSGPDHEVWILRVADLLRQQFQPQRLRSQSARVTEAHFVRQGGQRGIALRETQDDGQAVQYLFDVDTRVLRGAEPNSPWQLDQAASANWELREQLQGTGADRRLSIRARGPRGSAVTVRLPEDQEEITSKALLAGASPEQPTLLAVASHFLGQPLLSVYRLDTGDRVRQLTGHTERIRSLSFAADGRLLISTGDDQTVCVWSLTDLDAVLDKHGVLAGVAVDDSDSNGPVVVRVEPESPAGPLLAVGDHLSGYLDGDTFRPWNKAREFYDTWWLARPQAKLTVRRVRGAQDTRDIVLQTGQGVDEHKPLFSFFLAQATANRPRQWVGWSPLGPFESSDEQVERFLGWHFNTGNPQRPTEFADLNQYRERYYRQGLLKDLITHGELLAPREPDPLARPTMSLWIPEAGIEPVVSDGHVVLRQSQPLTLAMDLDFAFPAALVDAVECRADGQVVGPMQHTTGSRWEIDLSSLALGRGVHRLEAILRTRERRPQDFAADLQVRYQPPAPQLRIATPALLDTRQATVQDEQFTLDAEILPSAGEEPIEAWLYELRDQQRQQIKHWTLQQGGTISQAIPLRIGSNHLQLEVRNAKALSDYAAFETATESLTITRQDRERPLAPPKLTLQIVEPRDSQTDVQFGQLIVSHAPRLALRGTITSEDALEIATIQIGREGLARPLTGVPPQSAAGSVDFAEVIEGLAPGTTDVLLLVRSAKGTTTELLFEVAYTPPLPELEIVAPQVQDRVLLLAEEQLTRPFVARLQFPPGAEIPEAMLRQLRAAIEVNGQPPQPVTIDTAQRTLTADVALVRGDNKVRWRVNYDWNSNDVRRSDPILVTCFAEPRITQQQVLQQSGSRRGELILGGQVDGGVARISIGDRELSPQSWSLDRTSGAVHVRASIEAAPGDEVAIHVAGVAKPFRFPVPPPQLVAQPPAPPEVEFLSPSQDTNTQQRELAVRFLVHSASPLVRVQLQQNQASVFSARDVDLQQQVTQQQGRYTLEQSVTLQLAADSNSLELIAENADGLTKRALTVNLPPPPIRVVVDAVRDSAGEDTDFRTQPVNDPIASVVGRVVYRDASDPRCNQRQMAKIWVNGFLQTYEELPTAGQGRERAFEVPVILSRRDSLVEIELPGLERDIRDELRYPVRCAKPVQEQRLHLLIIGVGTDLKEEPLIQGALQTLDARRDPAHPDLFSTPIFSKGIIYGPLTAESVDQQTVRAELFQISRQIEIRKRQPNATGQDLVIIYYTGGELIANERQFYLTTEPNQAPADLPHYGIASEELKAFVEKTLGAHLLLLDVSRSCEKHCDVQTWPATSHAAMLRFAWLNPNRSMPEQARLISALQQLSPQSHELAEVDQQLAERLKSLQQIYADTLAYDRHLPDSLRNLLLRGTTEDQK